MADWSAFPLVNQRDEQDDPWAAFPIVEPTAPARPAQSALPNEFADLPVPGSSTPQQPEPEPSLIDQIMGAGRGLQIGTQGVGSGVAGLAGALVDIVSAIMNVGLGGAEMAANAGLGTFGADPVEFPRVSNPVGGSDWMRDVTGQGFEALGGDLIDYDDMSFDERLAYNVNRFGTEALLGGGALAMRGAARAAVPNATPQFGDALSRAYTGPNAMNTLRADIAGGAGMGGGFTLAEAYAPDNEWAQLGGALGGGVGGSVLGAGLGAPRALVDTIMGFTTDPNIPYAPGTLAPTSRRVADASASFMQNAASDPQAAAAQIAARQQTAQQFSEPVPTSGIASGDTGLVGTELAARQNTDLANPGIRRDFIENDQALQTRAAENVDSLRDPGADQAAALDYAQNRPNEIAAQRDAAALPLLRQAEASGVQIDAAPVVQVIDGMLAEAKRPAVRNALTEARQMLNAVGTDQLDTSVSGLYETRKAINDIIQGRSDTSTGRFAQSELIQVRDALDEAITNAVPEFGQYLDTYRQGSRALDVFETSQSVARLMGEDRDLRNVAKRILSSGDYGTDQLISEINSVIGNNPEALRAWRAAVADELSRRVSTTRDDAISLAALRRTFGQHETALAQIFSPDDMATLRRAHEMLEPLQQLGQSVRAGSHTADNQQLANAFEGAVLAATGNAITTGMVMRRIRVIANLLGLGEMTMPHKVKQVLGRAWFDPDLARHLLERPVSEGTGPLWNGRLRNLLGVSELARASVDEDDPQLSTEDLIMQGLN